MKLATIELISEILPHTNADSLEIAKVLGWQSVVRKGQFKAGDKVVFIPIDTILPDAPWSTFLKKGDKPIKLNTVKLRGAYSQGLVQPIDILPIGSQSWHVGSDVGGELGIKKYEKEIPACLSGEVKCAFPTFLAPRTDEDNGLSHPELVNEVLRHDCFVTLKLDGSSCTIIVENGVVQHVCSRNLSLKETKNNGFWYVVNKIKDKLGNFTGVIQGELMGPGIQGNQLGLKEPTLYVFQIKSTISGTDWHTYTRKVVNTDWLAHNHMVGIANAVGLHAVKKIKEFKADTMTLEQLQLFADEQTIEGKPAEGIVVRPFNAPFSGAGRPLGFKIINRNYKDT